MTYVEKIFDLTTGLEVIRPFTNEEIKNVELAITKAETETAKKAEIDEKRFAIFAKLGITEEEAKLLLG